MLWVHNPRRWHDYGNKNPTSTGSFAELLTAEFVTEFPLSTAPTKSGHLSTKGKLINLSCIRQLIWGLSSRLSKYSEPYSSKKQRALASCSFFSSRVWFSNQGNPRFQTNALAPSLVSGLVAHILIVVTSGVTK